jgi:alpha-N-arabinofuranosidase
MALTHNLVGGGVGVFSDPRETPFHPPHSVAIAGLYAACGGDHRLINNLLLNGKFNQLKLPDIIAGNVINSAIAPQLTQKSDGWYLTFNADPAWRATSQSQLVTTDFLGKAKVSGCAYENPDGSPLNIDADYFGKKRDGKNPFPGPFESALKGGTVKVWPIISK